MKAEYDFSKGKQGRFYSRDANLNLPTSDEKPDWAGIESPLGKFVVEQARRTLNSYREQPNLVTEHANHERDTAHGGYAHRQLFELVQNSADALSEAPHGKSILIRLTERYLYCADDGKPIDENGVRGLMFSHMSSKRNTAAIGRFGLGFKSVLGVTDSPEFYSRSGSFLFDSRSAAKQLRSTSPTNRFPVLRLPEPIDPHTAKVSDDELRELMSWATNIVRLPIGADAHRNLARQIKNFPAEFLLLVNHVRFLTFEDGKCSRDILLHDRDGEFLLDADGEISRWQRFDTTCRLSCDARNDWPLRGDDEHVPIQWAVPLNRLDRPGYFWAYFPTSTASLVAGILNAPWKTNEDRQNLLPGPYNEELIDAAAAMVADALPRLMTLTDPARHLDALPRRKESGDSEHSVVLRECLFSKLCGYEIVPDQDGVLREISEISYPPEELTNASDPAPLERWAAYPGRPRDWLHHSACKRNRLAAIDRFFHHLPWKEYDSYVESNESDYGYWGGVGEDQAAVRASIAHWLEALLHGNETDTEIRASMAAVKVAAAIPPKIRSSEGLGHIVLTKSGDWQIPDPDSLFLAVDVCIDEISSGSESYVHPELASDSETIKSLRVLGIQSPSPEATFRLIAKRIGFSQNLHDGLYRRFWALSRALEPKDAQEIVAQFGCLDSLRIRTLSGEWQPLHSVLLPGEIVPRDGSRDSVTTVDTSFHKLDENLIREFGVTEKPQGYRNLSLEPQWSEYERNCEEQYRKRPDLPHEPAYGYLGFNLRTGAGPLNVLAVLSDEGGALYTDALLKLPACYKSWTMRHSGTNRKSYPKMKFDSLAIHMLRIHGKIRVADEIVPLADALGSSPRHPEALHTLLAHPMADKLKTVFDLAEPIPEFFGEADPIPLTDIWPGLKEYLPEHRMHCRLAHCERILVLGQLTECVFYSPDLYLLGNVEDDEQRKLRLVVDELELELTAQQIDEILHRRTPQEVEDRRIVIRRHSTDAERLLAALGENTLRAELPDSLLAVLESEGKSTTGIDIAEAAIATWHTDALKQYRTALDHLDPPSHWAGSSRAIKFVRSLGFAAEWAGERRRKRGPFVEALGPYSLPKLHPYQYTITENIRKMLRAKQGNGAERRGMVSLPTGSGKTRVAVQAIVEAMRDDGFVGDVLWVADRDELCEQAVEAWRQVWTSIGAPGSRLRISRMWAGQPKPRPTSDRHVVVATIQTLNAKLSNHRRDYQFLSSSRLVVFDEAHRSIAPTFTSVMQEIGLTRFQRVEEPFLIGLTATPYRGHDEEETKWLVRRYGSRRLDTGAFVCDEPDTVIRYLQNFGVLAQADHETIEGESFSLADILGDALGSVDRLHELEKWRRLPWLPQSVEKRIALSASRTKRIIEAYKTYIEPNWPTLIFATSVEHAKTLAALLNRSGIRSRAVSGETETATRRRVVEEFRGGAVKALVNYGVFREGFDAPKTRAVIVARPVYSPNLYFQMIGRGLRGPRNGGSDRCLILNVRDNIQNFDRRLAFSELDWLWADL